MRIDELLGKSARTEADDTFEIIKHIVNRNGYKLWERYTLTAGERRYIEKAKYAMAVNYIFSTNGFYDKGKSMVLAKQPPPRYRMVIKASRMTNGKLLHEYDKGGYFI